MVELSAGASVAIGVLVGLISTSVQSIGLTLQRKSHLLEEKKDDAYDRRPPYKRRRWQIGMLMFIVANLVGSSIQITTLPLPVLSTLQASGLVFNSICASVILSEPFTRYSLVGTILVAAGAVLIGIFGALTEPSHNLDQLLALLGRRQFVLWMFGTAVLVLALVISNWALKRAYPRQSPRLRLARGMSFGCVSGILSAHSLLLAKSAVELLVRTIVDRHNEFNRWQSWMILVGLVPFAVFQLYHMHRGLKLCSTSVLYPLVFCVYNIIAILDGLIYFHQSARLSALHAGLIALGTVILLAGVVSLSWRLEEETEEPTAPSSHRFSRIPTTQTGLTPGMGIVPGALDEEPESPGDMESAMPGLHGAAADWCRKQNAADESTPLLARKTTAPALQLSPRTKRPAQASYSPKASPSSLRPHHRRRVTISQETSEIWNELNDRESGQAPGRRSADLERRPRSGTLPARRRSSAWAGQNHNRRRSWWDGMSGLHPFGSTSKGTGPRFDPDMIDDDGDDGDESGPDAVLSPLSRRSASWAFGHRGRGKDQEGLGDWLRLKWWKKRWREGGENGDSGG